MIELMQWIEFDGPAYIQAVLGVYRPLVTLSLEIVSAFTLANIAGLPDMVMKKISKMILGEELSCKDIVTELFN